MGLFSSSEFSELSLLVEKATSEFIPAAQEDLALNLEITDIIKSKRVNPKDALRLLITRLIHENPNVQLLTLCLLDKCIKNGGKHFLIEMAGREFVDVAVSMMDDNEYGNDCNHIVQEKLIEYFQEWALIFQSDPALIYLYDTYCQLKNQRRVYFPVPAKSLDQVDPLSIVSSLAPPEWNDSPACQRCRDTFTLTNRKHHCRKCGGTFCHLCSSNEMVLLEMGITDPVRVCDSCYKMPLINEKRRAKVFEKSGFPGEDDADLKKAIENSLKDLKEPTTLPENSEKEFDSEALTKAIEASLKEAGPNHMNSEVVNNNIAVEKPRLEYFNNVELENISLFHQLIGRLIRTRPTLTPEDALDLKNLWNEMRKFLNRPIEDESLKSQLEESIKGYELLYERESENAKASSPQSVTATTTSDTSQELAHMRTEVLIDPSSSAGIGVMQNRLSSLSLENVNTPSSNILNRPVPTMIPQIQIPLHQQLASPPQSSIPSQFAPVQAAPYTPIQVFPFNSQTPQSHEHTKHTPIHPIQMCPELTIHPHPIHPMIYENPYAIKHEVVKIDKKKKKKKGKREDKDKDKDEEKDVVDMKGKKSKKSGEKKLKKPDEKKEKESNENKKKEKEKKKGSKDIDAAVAKSSKKHGDDAKSSETHIFDIEAPKSSVKHINAVTKSSEKQIDAIAKSSDKSIKKKSKKRSLESKDKKSKKQTEESESKEEDGRKSPINLIDL